MNVVELDQIDVVRSGRCVLSKLSLRIAARERVALLGRNGTGKSTLLDVVLGLRRPVRGRVSVLGQVPPAPDVGFVAQHVGASLLPWLSVADNALLPLKLRRTPQPRAQLELARVCELVDPGRTLDLHAPPMRLSLGQRQLAALLRALIGRPRLLLCDEPFSALDAESVRRVQGVLLNVTAASDGPALLFVTHAAQDVERLADRSLRLVGDPASVSEETSPVRVQPPMTRGAVSRL